MAQAARPPQPSNPSGSAQIFDTITFDDVQFILDRRIPFSIEDVFNLDSSIAIGKDVPFQIEDTLDIDVVLFHFKLIPMFISDIFDIDMIQNFTEQLLPVEEAAPPVDVGDAVARLDNLEHDLVISSTNPQFFKEFVYTGEDLTGINIYRDASKLQVLYTVAFSFSGGDLVTKTISRLSDNRQLII